MVNSETTQRFNMLKQSYFINVGQTNSIVEGMLNELSDAIVECEIKIAELTKENTELKEKLKDTVK